MKSLRATVGRTVGRARSLYSTAFAVGAFLAVAALLFARSLETADGGGLTLPVLLATGAAPVLPVLAALLGMGVWSDERQSGRIEALLTVAVRERDFVIGKFLGVFALLMSAVVLFLLFSLVFLRVQAPCALKGVTSVSCLFPLLALAVQGALWSAVAVMASAAFRHAASAACATVVLLIAIPRGVWEGMAAWSRGGRTLFGELPLDAHVVDIASGIIPVGTVALYFVLTVLTLLVATKRVAAVRLVGRGATTQRLSTGLTVVLAAILAVLSAFVFARLNPVCDLSGVGRGGSLSLRTRSILAESSGSVVITAFVSRKDPSFRSVGRVLRLLKRQSESVGGIRIELRFVDPKWDIGAAERLIRCGASENSLVFERGRRLISVAVRDGFGERLCASTIRRISSPVYRRNVYWTAGHGETRFDDYSAFGMSDVARELFQEGFGNRTIDLAATPSIPGDCALILVAGARDDFSRAELDKLNAYLQEGGRLLVLLGSAKSGGVVPMLPAWGVRPLDGPLSAAKPLAGGDVIVSRFGEHPVTAPLRESRIVLERPVALSASAVVDRSAGVDSLGYVPIAEVGASAVVASVERGGGAGVDLALRPTRLIVVGDASFVLNGQLAVRACANRDFFLNCVAYLSGAEAHGSGEASGEAFRSGMDRRERLRHAIGTAVAFPAAVFVVLTVFAARRRHRS